MGHETILVLKYNQFPRRLLTQHIIKVVPQFRGLVRSFTPRRPVFNYLSVHVVFMMDNSALR